jgi:hypothetical protein
MAGAPSQPQRPQGGEKTERRSVRLESPDPNVVTDLWVADVTWDQLGFVKPLIYRARLWRFSHEEVPVGRDPSHGTLLVFKDAGEARATPA